MAKPDEIAAQFHGIHRRECVKPTILAKSFRNTANPFESDRNALINEGERERRPTAFPSHLSRRQAEGQRLPLALRLLTSPRCSYRLPKSPIISALSVFNSLCAAVNPDSLSSDSRIPTQRLTLCLPAFAVEAFALAVDGAGDLPYLRCDYLNELQSKVSAMRPPGPKSTPGIVDALRSL